ncbi:hypothetical protein SS1G_12912 [Sclerotinia sclerotiorum 1980 UF-70]|uniref:RNase H type-1 domain-containing protein n=1 Tax=Sclerotinia sclerotiorum (strain ATCC 18683 / 1980 / Ss-1) TaxID=665079 RepID=A7F5N4_SCLS1|nr:hypothetical protein SS1G_12912 [Sclerotinia sclerotiorum 1980 UF-70]EDN98055.1 hypothetical protein SS1G_12912 [Sclerotinia sclerotiorum 1980 UF-70]
MVIIYTRAILPIYKTTNITVLYKEAKLRPSEIELNLISQLYTAQTIRLDLYYPLRIRAKNIIKAREYNYTPDTRFARLITTLLKIEHINPLAFPPWKIRESRAKAEACINSPINRTKTQATEDFKAFHAKIPRSDIQIFSDGSKSESKDGATGGGFIISQFDIQIVYYSFSLGINTEVFDAEVTAAVAGAAKALTLVSIKLATDLWIFLDNHKTALRLGSHFNGSSQRVFEDFLKFTQAWARATLHYILAIRSQYNNFAAYYEYFNHTIVYVHCLYGKRKTLLHFFFCKKGKAFKALIKSPFSEVIP